MKMTAPHTVEMLVYLCACAVNQKTPSAEKLNGINLEKLYDTAKEHLLQSAAGMALASAGIRDDRFEQAVLQAQRKNALLDADRTLVLDALEKAEIWYMPLKGAILKDLYPRFGMRQMADNDILFDADRRADVRKIMKGLGFTVKEYDKTNHDVYHRKPLSNFEMHAQMTHGHSNDQLVIYYRDVKDRLIKDEGNRCGYHFTDNDFYLFMVAHEYNHYEVCGTGLRSLLDIYVYLKQKGKELDWAYIDRETKKMGVAEFETLNRSLACKLFDDQPLTAAEQKMLNYIVRSGVYGTKENEAGNQIREKGRWRYFLSRLTLPYEDMRNQYPILRKAPILYPVMWVWRLIRMFIIDRRVYVLQVKAALGIIKPEKDEGK